MDKKVKKKWIYRDNESNRLLTKDEAERRDENTWTKEEFVIQPADDPPPEPKT